MDADKDGSLSSAEMRRAFDSIDVNADGQISKEELRAHLVKSGLTAAQCAAVEELFDKLDADGSGHISKDEFFTHFEKEHLARYARATAQTFLTKGRLIAYTSDVGESVRPVMPPWFVNLCYGLTFLYVAVDIGHNVTEAQRQALPSDLVARAGIHSATFQLIASVAIPSLIIHQVVHFAQDHVARRLPAGRLAAWLPTLVGLCCIPLLPFIDEPAEHAIDAAFDAAWPVPAEHQRPAHH